MSNEYEGLGLSADEIAALSEPDGDTTATQGDLEASAAAPAAKTTTDTEDDDAAAGEDKDGADAGATAAAGDASAATEQPAAAEATPPAAAEPTPAPSPAPQQAPILVAQAPEDADAKLADIASQKADLRKKYDDGEITFDEYEAKKDTLNDQKSEIELAVREANLAQKLELQRQQNQWNADCDAFMDKHKELYAGEANAPVFADLNAAIKAIAVMPSSASLTGPQILDRAHRAVMAARGTPVVDEAKPDPKPAPRKEVPKPALPPDLGKMPSATGNDPGEGKWASLDRLQESDPNAYTAALEKMSPAERELYLAA